MQAEQRLAIKALVTLFDKAEDKVKEIEQLDREISIPSINELRYVGYHLARLFCEEQPEKIDEQIKKAQQHCQRAIYDAHEIGIIYMLEQIKAFKERYIDFPDFVIEVIPDYTDSLRLAQSAATFISRIKENHRDDRGAYYAECEPHYLSLRKVFDTLSVASPLIEKKRSGALRKDKQETRRFILQTLLIILSIIVAIIFGMQTP